MHAPTRVSGISFYITFNTYVSQEGATKDTGGWAIDFLLGCRAGVYHQVTIHDGWRRRAGAAPFGFKGADFDLAISVEEAKRNALRRFYGLGDLHFVTFSCYRRRPYLGTVDARNCFVKILDEVRSRHGFALFGYVLMPEHVHLLMGEPEHGNPSKVLQVLKQKMSRTLCGNKISSGSVAAPAFWQRRFYDFNVWSEKKVKEKLDYMHRNPVDRKLVQHPQDWPWSSWGFYVKGEQGLIRIDELTPKPE